VPRLCARRCMQHDALAQDVTRDVQEEKPELLQDLGKFVANMDQKLLELPEV